MGLRDSAAVARLRGGGSGFLIAPHLVMTCAHVVNLALGRDPASAEWPTIPVTVELPFARLAGIQAGVVEWRPMADYRERTGDALHDVAVLELAAPVTSVPPVRLTTAGPGMLRCFGFPSHTGDAGEIAETTLLAEDAVGWLHLRPARTHGAQIGAGYSGTPIFAEDGGVIGMITACDDAQGLAYGESASRLPLAWPLLARPYKGLSRFEASDAPWFFGRETLAREIGARLLAHEPVMLVGPSGVGKSSLVHGGVLPWLDPALWRVVALRPGADPLAAAAAALMNAQGWQAAQALMAACREDGPDGARLLARLVQAADLKQGQRLLLVADGMEELFTLSAGPARAGFAALLAAAARDPGAGLGLLGTLRADFTGAVLSDPVLAAAFDGRFRLLRAMNAVELGRAIRLPAQKLGVQFEDGIDDELLAAVAHDPGALPLMEFVLELLWAAQRGRLITRKSFAALGGLGGALAAHADEILGRLSPAGQEAMRRLLCRLVRVGAHAEADVKLPRRRAELGEDAWSAALHLSGSARLVAIGCNDWGEETAELIHESLLRFWPRLQGWIEAERALLRLAAAIEAAAEKYASDPEQLLRGRELAEAWAQRERLRVEFPHLAGFLEASHQVAAQAQALSEADAVWDQLEFAGGCATEEESAVLARLAEAPAAVRCAFMGRALALPARARRLNRLPMPVLEAALGTDDRSWLAAAAVAAIAPGGRNEIRNAALWCLAVTGRDDAAVSACGAGLTPQAVAAWVGAIKVAPARRAGLLDWVMAIADPADPDWHGAVVKLAGGLGPRAAERLLNGAMRILVAKTTPLYCALAAALALRLPAGSAVGWFGRIWPLMKLCPSPADLRLWAPVALALVKRMPKPAAQRAMLDIAAAIEPPQWPLRRRCWAQLLLALARANRPLPATIAETLLGHLWQPRARAAEVLDAATQAALVLAAGLNGAWAARVLDRVVDAIGQSGDAGELELLAGLGRDLAVVLAPHHANRAFARGLELLGWSVVAPCHDALGGVLQGLAGRLNADQRRRMAEATAMALGRSEDVEPDEVLRQVAELLGSHAKIGRIGYGRSAGSN